MFFGCVMLCYLLYIPGRLSLFMCLVGVCSKTVLVIGLLFVLLLGFFACFPDCFFYVCVLLCFSAYLSACLSVCLFASLSFLFALSVFGWLVV